MEALKIIGLGLAAAVGFGIALDQVTARVCLEYFTVGHPRIIDSEDPTLIALAWGVVATWWVGLPLGAALAFVSRAGSWPKLRARDLATPLLLLLATMAVVTFIIGYLGWRQAEARHITLIGPLAEAVPAHKHVAFLADLWAHLAAYITGILGGATVCVWALLRRRRLFIDRAAIPPDNPSLNRGVEQPGSSPGS